MAPTTMSLDVSSASFNVGTGFGSSTDSSLMFTHPRLALKNPLRVSARKMSKELAKESGTSNEEQRLQILKLKKRFLKSKEMLSASIAKTKARDKILQEVIYKIY